MAFILITMSYLNFSKSCALLYFLWCSLPISVYTISQQKTAPPFHHENVCVSVFVKCFYFSSIHRDILVYLTTQMWFNNHAYVPQRLKKNSEEWAAYRLIFPCISFSFCCEMHWNLTVSCVWYHVWLMGRDGNKMIKRKCCFLCFNNNK